MLILLLCFFQQGAFARNSYVPDWMKDYKNTDGQTCHFEQMPEEGGWTAGYQNRNCGWNGVDSKFQKKFERKTIYGCIQECLKLQWCNYAYNDADVNGAIEDSGCYLFGTCDDQTSQPAEGHLAKKVCPRQPEMPRTPGPACTAGCEKHKGEWMGDGMCDFDECQNCESYYDKSGVFDKGDCAGEGHFTCIPGCKKFVGEWKGDGSCDTDCLGCKEYYKNGIFDGGDCPTTGATMAMVESLQGSSSFLIHGFSVVGFVALAYGASCYYFGK